MSSVASRIAAWAIALVVGGVYGAAGSFAHAASLGVLPVGIVLGLVGAAALLIAVRLLTADRWATLAAGAGMVAATMLFALPSTGGSVLFTTQHEMLALLWTAGAPIVTVLVVAWPAARGRVAREAN